MLRTRGPARRSVASASTHGGGRAASSVLTADPAGHLAVRKANGRSFLVPSAETLWEDARPPPGVLRDPHAAAARSRRGGREPSVCRVTARCHGESSGDPGAPAPKAPCAFGGGGGRGRSSRSLDVETPPGLTEGGELKSSGERSRGQRGRPSQGRPWRWRPWVIIKDPMRIPMMVTRRSPRGSRLQKLLVPWSWGAPPPHVRVRLPA